MSAFLQKILRRTTVVGLLILVQLVVLVATVMHLSNHYVYVYAAFAIISVGVTLVIINRRDNPSYKLAWIVLVMGLPVFGGLFYLMFGGHRVSKKLRRRVEQTGVSPLLPGSDDAARFLQRQHRNGTDPEVFCRPLRKWRIPGF